MMRTLFISLSLLAAGGLSACGFSPLHGQAETNAALADIDLGLIKGSNVVDNQAGFFVLQRLRDRIGTSSASAPYTLEITPRYNRRRLGLTVGDVASRYDITVTANWELLDSESGKTLKKGRSSSIVTFGAPDGPFGVITADSVGVEESARETADKMVVQLAKFFALENTKTKK